MAPHSWGNVGNSSQKKWPHRLFVPRKKINLSISKKMKHSPEWLGSIISHINPLSTLKNQAFLSLLHMFFLYKTLSPSHISIQPLWGPPSPHDATIGWDVPCRDPCSPCVVEQHKSAGKGRQSREPWPEGKIHRINVLGGSSQWVSRHL